MSRVLLVLGVIVTLLGAAMVAYGIPINEFGLGNTLIIAGTTAIVGGLILIALSNAVKQLRRIAENLAVGTGSGVRTAELFDADERPARIPFPPKPEPRVRPPMQAPAEPRLAAAPSLDTVAEELDRAPAFTRAPEPRVQPEHSETPFLPRESNEPRVTAAKDADDDLSQGLLATAFARLDVSMRPAPPSAEPDKQDDMLESVWPAEPRQTAEMPPDAPEAQPPEPAPTSKQAAEKQPEEPYAVSILKSGVVDGMAYTLYSDGSIEAEMPQGTMRFASIVELRAYLEGSS
jgi:hypothetical protein